MLGVCNRFGALTIPLIKALLSYLREHMFRNGPDVGRVRCVQRPQLLYIVLTKACLPFCSCASYYNKNDRSVRVGFGCKERKGEPEDG
ncbi:MAG TPA: hypothetical protein DEF06_01435 [Clostridiales bacterium]|nr:hypothetical protein [Clostridiales bacterium]